MIIDTTNDELLINGQRWQRGGYLLATAYSTDQINITARDGRVIGKAIEWDRILDKDKNTFGLDRDGTLTALTSIFNSQAKSPYKINALRDVENGTAAYGEIMIYRSPGEWQYEVLEQYHGAYDSEAATLRSGATATLELYYTAQADGDGISELSQSNTPASGYQIIRKLYYAERAQQDPDTGTWVQFADLAANTSFNDAKNTLLAYLKERTGGTVPISLKMTWEEVELLLLELYPGAAAAYSLRLLDNTYTGSAIRVRRASDNAEQDIGFDGNGDLDTSALATFCSGTDGFVKTWYNQASSNDATQPTAANQPNIYYTTYDNALLQSNTFNTTWTLSSTSVTSGQSGYDGSSDAWLLNSTATGSPRIQQSVSISGESTFSIYAKAATDDFLQMRCFMSPSGDATVWVDLSNGVIVNSSGAAIVSSSIESIGSGWYRCSITFDGVLSTVRIYPASAFGVYSTSGNGVYIQDAQLETGDTATDYVETTTTAATTGHVVTIGGRPAMQFDGINDGFSADYTDIKQQARFDAYMHYQTTDSLFLMFTEANNSGRFSFTIQNTSTSTTITGSYGTPELYVNGTNANIVYGTTTRDDLHDIIVTNGASDSNGAIVVHQGAKTTNWIGFLIGNYGPGFSFLGKMTEIVIYNTDQSTNRTGIEDNINDYYSIYP